MLRKLTIGVFVPWLRQSLYGISYLEALQFEGMYQQVNVFFSHFNIHFHIYCLSWLVSLLFDCLYQRVNIFMSDLGIAPLISFFIFTASWLYEKH